LYQELKTVFNFENSVEENEMKNRNSKDIKRTAIKNTVQYRTSRSESSKCKFKNERRNKMKRSIFKNMKANTLLAVLLFFLINGCGDSNVAGIHENEPKISGAGENFRRNISDTTSIRLDMSLKFKSESISDSKLLESNTGNQFNNILSIERDIKPGEEINFYESQPPYGIHALFFKSDGSFTLTNSSGLSITAKSLLMEKCEFIDLILKNEESKAIHVVGFIAGE
jgi:hypothetical protein